MAIIKTIRNLWTIAKSVNIDSPAFREIFPTVFADGSGMKTPFKQHPGIYAAIMVKARNLAQVPLRIYKKDTDVEVSDLMVNMLFERPNPRVSENELIQGLVIYLDNYGEAFLLKDDQEISGVPQSLSFLDPRSVSEVTQGGMVTQWKYGNAKYDADRIIQMKYFSPYTPYRGLAPLDALRDGLTADWNAVKYNKNFFQNDGTPGVTYSTGEHLSDTAYERLAHQLIDTRTGVKNSHRPMILEGGLTASTTRIANKDMEFLEGRKYTIQEIAMVYGVPKEALQIYEDINYATAVTADLSLWKKTLMPLGSLITGTLNHALLNPAGYEARLDYASVDVLNAEMVENVEAAERLWHMGVPFNMINQRLGLGFEDVPGGDNPRVEFAAPRDTEKSYTPGIISTEETIKAMRDAKWKELTDPLDHLVVRLSRAVREYFYQIERKITKRVSKQVRQSKELSAEDYQWISELFSDEKLRELVEPEMDLSMGAGYDTIATSFAIEPPPQFFNAVKNRVTRVTGINNTAREVVIDRIQDKVMEGTTAGLTEDEIAQSIQETVKEAMEINMHRARTIARTETHGAFSEGRHVAAEQTGPTTKTWITSRDNRVRDWHLELEGETVPFSQPYTNGLMYPHDWNAPGDEVINCRCVEVYGYAE